MSVFCSLIDLAGADVQGSGVLRKMAAASHHPALQTAAEVGAGSFAAVSPLWSSASGVWVATDARLDEPDTLRKSLAPWLTTPAEIASEADLILAAYLRWGESSPEHLFGDYAFVLWDAGRQRLLAARDPLGSRPLHYARMGSLIGIASEAGALLAHPDLPREVDQWTIGEYLAGGIFSLDRTFFRHVRKLPPGHRLLVDASRDRIERFWDVPLDRTIVYRRTEEYAEHFLEAFERSVRERLRTCSTTIGVALSGGLDSSSVAAVAEQQLRREGAQQRLVSCSFVFPSLPRCDESPYIHLLTRSLGIKALTIDAERHWFLGDRKAYRPCLETPALSWESLYLEMVRHFQDKGAGIVLTGHGGDDLLRGSTLVFADRLRRGDLLSLIEVSRHARARGQSWRALYSYFAAPLLPGRVDRALRRLLRKPPPNPLIPSWISPDFVRRTDLAGRIRTQWEESHQGMSARQEMHYHLVVRPLYARSTEWYDRVGAPSGIDFRHPFLDRRLFELVVSFPPRQLIRLGTYKPLIRQAMSGLLPDDVRLRREKSKLGSFVDWSLRDKEADHIEALLADPVAAEAHILDGAVLRQAFREYRQGDPKVEQRALWYAITLELWLREHGGTLQGVRSSAAEAA